MDREKQLFIVTMAQLTNIESELIDTNRRFKEFYNFYSEHKQHFDVMDNEYRNKILQKMEVIVNLLTKDILGE